MSAVCGIEAIKLHLPLTNDKINTNVREERGQQAVPGSTPLPTTTYNRTAMTSVERYRQEWSTLLADLDDSFERLRDLAFSGDLKVSKFRSVYWALLLRVLNADYRSWKDQREQQRKRYDQLKQEFVKNPHDIKRSDDDPLSQSKQSVWNQYFSDQELFAVIKQDVVRTFPGVDFFRKKEIQTAMTNILFYFAREHPYMCYRQGMHEILAPILFVMFSDHQSLLHYKEIARTPINDVLLDVLNPDYLEADSFSIFSRLMALIESYYRITNVAQTSSNYISAQTDNKISSEVEVINHLNSIRDKILAKEDLHLHNYLLKLEIPLHIFGIRWLRLLFGREFALLDLLVVWDAIFADSDHFDLPNYILVAMLIRIREKLLMNDYITCLTHLMRYPANVDINLILRHALHMQMPKKFDRPPNAFVYCTMSPATQSTAASSNLSTTTNTLVDVRRTPSAAHRSGVHGLKSEMLQRTRSISLGSTMNGVKIEQQIETLKARNAENSAALARMRAAPETDRVIMDGLSENSPELLRLELKNAQTIISVARNKLQKYLDTVRKNIVSTNNNSVELTHALDGIEELCSFLDVKFMFPLQSRTAPIDPAFEANENHQRQSKPNQWIPNLAATNTSEGKSSSNQQKKQHLDAAKMLEADDVLNDHLQVSIGGTMYEKPDNGFMRSSHRILGNRKEIELVPIASDERIEVPVIRSGSANQQRSTLQGAAGLPVVDPLGLHDE